MTKADDALWSDAQDAVMASLGFRIIVERDKTPESYQLQQIGPSEKPEDHGKLIVLSVRPTEKQMWELWCEAVRFRVEHDAACKLAWGLYSAAMGVDVDNFNGMPAGGPVQAVRDERARIIKQRDDYQDQIPS